MKLINILKEIQIANAAFTPKDLKALDILTYLFGEGNSNSYRDIPMSETYTLENYVEEYEDDPSEENYKQLQAIQHLLKKPRKYYTLNLEAWSWMNKAPSAPLNSFNTLVEIDKTTNSITVSSPYIATDVDYFMGWFDSSGKYHPDTVNFTEDGDYIGGQNA